MRPQATDADRIAQLEHACRALAKALKLSNAFAVSCANKHLGTEAAKSVASLTKAQAALDEAAMVLAATTPDGVVKPRGMEREPV